MVRKAMRGEVERSRIASIDGWNVIIFSKCHQCIDR